MKQKHPLGQPRMLLIVAVKYTGEMDSMSRPLPPPFNVEIGAQKAQLVENGTMEPAPIPSSDIAFTRTVKEIQRKGSRRGYARMEEGGSWETTITPELAGFIEKQTSVFLATANGQGQPYIQHRGGPSGFLCVLDEKTVAFVDFAGNRQYISQGNLAENPKAYLFLIDYTQRRRIKIWGKAQVIEGDAELTARLMPGGYKARAEQVILFNVSAWDSNCPQHIPLRFEAADVTAALAERDKRIEELKAELLRLQGV